MEEFVINFYCPNCGEKVTTIIRGKDHKDVYHCDCKKIWLVMRPIDISGSLNGD